MRLESYIKDNKIIHFAPVLNFNFPRQLENETDDEWNERAAGIILKSVEKINSQICAKDAA
jgi:hypothetical protein